MTTMEPGKAVKLFCTDLDETVYGNHEATARFNEFWERLPRGRRPILSFNSGRLVADQINLVRTTPLPNPDFLIGGVGTRIWDFAKQEPLTGYEESFADGWDRARIRRILGQWEGIEEQPQDLQTEFKSSWYWRGASADQLSDLQERLAREGLKVTVIYSSSRDLDILPETADKGDALVWLCRHLGIETREVVVAGNTGNDARMFQIPGVRGILVGNAQFELIEETRGRPVYQADAAEADGVIEGLRQYGVGDGLIR